MTSRKHPIGDYVILSAFYSIQNNKSKLPQMITDLLGFSVEWEIQNLTFVRLLFVGQCVLLWSRVRSYLGCSCCSITEIVFHTTYREINGCSQLKFFDLGDFVQPLTKSMRMMMLRCMHSTFHLQVKQSHSLKSVACSSSGLLPY